MTTRNRTSTAYGDATPLPGAADASQASQASAGGVPSAPAAVLAKAEDTSKPEPAFAQPSDSPAVPVDEHHGKGGEYHLIDGKRVLVSHTDDELQARGTK